MLNKAQLQFDERNYKLESGYISDLRQYCRIVTVCEEQLILSLVEYELKFLGELIKVHAAQYVANQRIPPPHPQSSPELGAAV